MSLPGFRAQGGLRTQETVLPLRASVLGCDGHVWDRGDGGGVQGGRGLVTAFEIQISL